MKRCCVMLLGLLLTAAALAPAGCGSSSQEPTTVKDLGKRGRPIDKTK